MAIIAFGVSALVISAGASARRADMLRDREMARWVASNRLTELQSVPSWSEFGTTNDEEELAGFTWYVRTTTLEVADDDIRRVDVEVRREEDAEGYLYRASGFVGNPELRL
ncbi:MAG: type II secretion system protein GspI [Gammaproteobacteria bacterium]|nr:MAG: type II secretion system protein GspI [Gammaproteobacteria bacterium]PIE37803.1 MAG: type II secretion system protein GspI [Gammaproteobacteria bacterium]